MLPAIRHCPLLWQLCKVLFWCKQTYRRNWIGSDRNFGALFFKMFPFWPMSDAALIFQIRPWVIISTICLNTKSVLTFLFNKKSTLFFCLLVVVFLFIFLILQDINSTGYKRFIGLVTKLCVFPIKTFAERMSFLSIS